MCSTKVGDGLLGDHPGTRSVMRKILVYSENG